MRRTRLTGMLLATFLAANPAVADNVTIGAIKDNTLYQSVTGDVSNGAGQSFFAGQDFTGHIKRGLIAFDVAGSVPAGSTITGVTLKLYMSKTSTGTESIGLHRVLADWGEGTSDATANEGAGAAAQPGDATWLYRFYNTSPWTTPGGDFASTASATTPVGGTGYYTWSGLSLVADVQAWLDSPAGSFGWLVLGNETAVHTAKRFESRESLVAEERPALRIDYVPEPATAFVLAGAAVLVRKRGPFRAKA